MRLITDYPWFMGVLCLLAGIAYALLLYWLPLSKQRPRHYIWASLLRALTVSIVAYLLLSPLIRQQQHEKERPIILMAQDNSQSIVLCKDSTYYRNDYAHDIDALVERLASRYDVHSYTFDHQLSPATSPSYDGTSTNITHATTQLLQKYEGQNIGALILSSDGLFNAGQNPTTTEPLPYPVFTIALGDTARRRDAAVTHLRHNRTAYLDNVFPLEITTLASDLQGRSQQLTVRHKGKTIFAETLAYSGPYEHKQTTVSIGADEAGLQSYTVTLSPLGDEVSKQNNTKTFTIEIIDGHQKIAIIAAAPHPDVAALRRSLLDNKNYEVDCFTGNQYKEARHNWKTDYDLIILHNLPQKGSPLDIDIANLSSILVVGSQTDLTAFNALNLGVQIATNIDKQTEATASFNRHFINFDYEYGANIEQMPPLAVPFGDYKVSEHTATLLYATIGNITTEQPVIALSQKQGIRHTMIFGEGLWRWRLYDYLENNNHTAFDQLIEQTATYTSLQTQQDRFRVDCNRVYGSNEPVIFEAELYNDNFELTNQPTAKITINNEEYVFEPHGNRYRLNIGMQDTGHYTYHATVLMGDKQYSARGQFVIENSNMEGSILVANHSPLNTLSQQTGGQMFYPSQLKELEEALLQRDDIKTIIYSHTSYRELLNLPLIFIIIIILLSAEWVIRKYNGEL
ncbi:MAG: hypothetical protein IJ620_04355 [Bacteroidales bacterium]|nr:hypothetical protein [Bacteroidales bacterium]